MITFEDFKKLDLRIARIIEVKDHPNAAKLLILKILVEAEEKQVVAGIKGYYSNEELIGKDVLIINNLEPAIIRGEESKGMVLAVKDEDTLSLLVPERKIKTGSAVS